MAGHGIARDQLRAFIERVERLEDEKKAIADDIKQVYAEAKGTGFNTKVMRQLVKLRKQDRHERAEFEAILDLYMHALGMIDNGLNGADEPDHEPEPDRAAPARKSHPAKGEDWARNPVGFEIDGAAR